MDGEDGHQSSGVVGWAGWGGSYVTLFPEGPGAGFMMTTLYVC